MDSSNNKVSIIMPCFNSEEYISEAIASVQNQTYENWEIIIVDDFSSDGSCELVLDIQLKDDRIILIRNETNKGSGFSRNKAIDIATGKYIAFLDSDDIWTPNKLEVQIDIMNKLKLPFSHTSYGYISERGDTIGKTFRVSKKLVGYVDLLKRTEISCLTAIYNQDMIGKYYMSEHSRKQDYALWLSILKDGYKSYPIDLELAYYRQRSDSSTSNKWQLLFLHVNFLIETQKFNLFKSIYYTFFWIKNGIVRYYINNIILNFKNKLFTKLVKAFNVEKYI